MNDPDKGATITITREELHRRAWETPPHELAQEFGITHRRLIEIFIKLAVPYPRRLYWRRKTAGKPVIALNLTSPPQDTPQYIVIEPTLPRRSPHEGSVPWHPLIASWHKERARLRALPPPYGTALDWTPLQLRQHKILDMIFKAVQKDGLVPRDARREKGFIFQYQSIEILCSLTEKKRRIQEPRVRTSEFVFVLKPTGILFSRSKGASPITVGANGWKRAAVASRPWCLRLFLRSGKLLRLRFAYGKYSRSSPERALR